MECNKDEAARAKYIAGEKMKAGDFVGAQKLVSKAQRLFPDLENIEQMITICDVQTSAEKKICGLDNWYAILQVQHFDDAITIKKQYRKLALLLHPDKNKFAGAEAAFKCVGEAYRLLYDQVKRSQYDIRYRSHSALANRRSNEISGRHCAAVENVATVTFWTCCNHCGHRYKYLKEYMNNVMHCSSCQKSYIACSTERDGVPRSSSTAGKEQQDQRRYTTFQQYYMASTGAESRTSKAETDKNVRVGRKLNKKNQGNQKKVAADWKPMKDEGCAGTDAEVENPQKSETSMDNSAEIPKADFVLKPQPEVKEAETGIAKPIPDKSAPKKKQAARKKRKTVGESIKSSEVDGSDAAEAKTDTKEVKEPEIGAGKSIPDLSAPKKKQAARKKRKTVEESTSEVDGSDVAGAKTDAKEVKEPETGAGKSIPDLAAPKKKQAAKKKTNSVEESTKSSEVDASDVNGATTDTNENSKRKSSRKKPQVSNTDEGSSGDFVSPPTKKTRSACEFESDSNAKQTTEDNTSPELADSGISPAASHACEGENKQSGGCEANGEDAALSSKNDKVDNGEKANGNPNTSDIPVSEFIVFENERKIANFAVKQVWSIRDSRDGMPRKYVRVKKVLNGEFKLQITYLDPIQDDSIPVACGEFEEGETEEIMDSSVFSSQMDYSVSNRTFSIFPKKGEIWALFREWNEEWGTLEKHELPYKYDFVQVLSDFHNVDGVGVAYLGKLKGFVSLFHFEAQNGVCQIQFVPEEIGRFSHKVPAVQMNGQEGKSVPPGSYELEPVALPRYIFQDGAADMEMDSEILKDKPDSPYPEAPQVEVKSKPVPETAESAKKRRKPDDDDSGICINLEEAKDGTSKTHDFSSCQVDEKKTRNESRKNGGAAVVFYQRKSPRLQKNPSPSQQGNEVNTAKKTDKGLVTYSLGNRKSPDGVDWPAEGQEGESSKKRGQRNSQLLSMSKQNDWRMLDGSSSRNHSPETTLVSTSCKTPQRKAFDFKSLRSEDKFRANQIWAVYSNDKGMPTEYVKIKKIVTKPQFKLHVAYMELFTPSSTEPVTTRPVSCGEFKLKTGKPKILPQTSFSHQINPDQNAKKKNIVEVYPKKGEVWALHKNSSSSNTEEHEIVEVVEEDEEIIKAVPLMALTAKGSNSLYETTRKKGSNSGFIGVPKAEMSKRFSHQIPAFRHLTRTTRLGERGCWELDPRAIPGRTILLD